MSDFDGFDGASFGDLDAELFDGFDVDDLEIDGLEVDDLGTEFPDPIDGADAADLPFHGMEAATGDVDAGPGSFDDPIVFADGTTYSGYTDFLSGVSPLSPSG